MYSRHRLPALRNGIPPPWCTSHQRAAQVHGAQRPEQVMPSIWACSVQQHHVGHGAAAEFTPCRPFSASAGAGPGTRISAAMRRRRADRRRSGKAGSEPSGLSLVTVARRAQHARGFRSGVCGRTWRGIRRAPRGRHGRRRPRHGTTATAAPCSSAVVAMALARASRQVGHFDVADDDIELVASFAQLQPASAPSAVVTFRLAEVNSTAPGCGKGAVVHQQGVTRRI